MDRDRLLVPVEVDGLGPAVPFGAVAEVDRERSARPGEVVAVRTAWGRVRLGLLGEWAGRQWLISPAGPLGPTPLEPGDTVVGVVEGVIRPG